MSTNPRFERFLERIDPAAGKRCARSLPERVLYSAPLVASFSMNSLEGVAQAQSRNQTARNRFPRARAGPWRRWPPRIGAAATLLLRRRRDR